MSASRGTKSLIQILMPLEIPLAAISREDWAAMSASLLGEFGSEETLHMRE